MAEKTLGKITLQIFSGIKNVQEFMDMNLNINMA